MSVTQPEISYVKYALRNGQDTKRWVGAPQAVDNDLVVFF